MTTAQTAGPPESAARHFVARSLMLTSAIFMVGFYVLVWAQAARGVSLENGARLWLAALASYAVVFSALWGFLALSDYVMPEYPDLLVSLTDRVGLDRFERWGLLVSIAAAVVCAIYAPAMVVGPVMGGVGFLAMLTEPAVERPTVAVNDLYSPPEADPSTVAPVTPEQAATGEVKVCAYTWTVHFSEKDAQSQSMTINVLVRRFEAFRAKNPYLADGQPRHPDFAEFVVRGITGELLQAARYLKDEAEKYDWTPYHEACNVLAFVQSLPYSKDTDSMQRAEYWRYPIETLHDGTGDCEDKAILAASLLRTLGHEVVMLDLPGHVAIGMPVPKGFPTNFDLVDGEYLYCEVTDVGWSVGEVPEKMAGKPITVVRLP